MADISSGVGFVKELAKEPIVYAFAFIVWIGANLLENEKGKGVNATWTVGLGLIMLGSACLMVRMCISIFDNNFKKKYTELIDIQSKTLKKQTTLINSLTAGTMEVHKTMVLGNQAMAGGYIKPESSATPTK